MSKLFFIRAKFITPIFFIMGVGIICQCSSDGENKLFDSWIDKFFAEYGECFPIQKCSAGWQNCNGRFDDYSPQQIQKIIATFQSLKQSISAIDPNRLSRKNQLNYNLLLHQADAILVDFDKMQRWRYDAVFYTDQISSAFIELLTCSGCKEFENSASLLTRLHALPGFLAQAQSNLAENKCANRSSAIDELENIKKIIFYYLPLQLTTIIPEADSVNAIIETSVASIENFQTFLKHAHDLKFDELASFDGKLHQMYFQQLLHVDITSQSLLDLMKSDFQRHYEKMMRVAEQYLKENHIIEAIKSYDHTMASIDEELEKQAIQTDEILSFCRDTNQDARRFISEIWNLSLPVDFSLEFKWGQAELMPAVEILYMPSPNLMEPKPQFSCYVQPIPGDQDWIHQLVVLRRYHKKAVTIEVLLKTMISHYKMWSLHRDKIPIVAMAFPDHAFLNGWSYYFSLAMLENGFGGYDPALNYILLKMYCRTLYLAQLHMQLFLGEISSGQIEKLLRSNSLFKKNEISELSKSVNCFSSENIVAFWGCYQLRVMEQASRQKNGARFHLDKFLNDVLAVGPVPLAFVIQHIDQINGDRQRSSLSLQ